MLNIVLTGYDALGRVLRTAVDLDNDGVIDTSDAITSYDYIGVGRLVTVVTGPEGHQRTTEYDRSGRVWREYAGTSPDFSTEYVYDEDPFGRLTRTILPAATSVGTRPVLSNYYNGSFLIASSDPFGRLTSFIHDGLGRVITNCQPNGTTNVSIYETSGHLLTDRLKSAKILTNGVNAQSQVFLYDSLSRTTGTVQDINFNGSADSGRPATINIPVNDN